MADPTEGRSNLENTGSKRSVPPGPDEAKATILVVDDEIELGRALSKLLGRNGYHVLTASNGEEGLATLRQNEVHLVLSDLQMPKMGGLDLLKAAQVISPFTEFVIITGHGTIEAAVGAIKNGAYDFIEKPFSTTTTLNVVGKALEKQQLKAENQKLRQQLEKIQGMNDIIGNSRPMQIALDTASQVAPSTATVLLTGESGTGKEVFASALHRLSDRSTKAMVRVSCAALPDNLLEAELFGYEPGAFTGAVGQRKGRFEVADGGTLFLDEVGEMSMTTQVKLLRVLQEGVVERLGSSVPLNVDVRIIAATNADLEHLVELGSFREDLFYRLNVINLELPPLRARGGDVILLANFFLQKYNERNKKNISGFTKAATDVLGRYSWPGNVRELENAMERAVVMCRGDFVDEQNLPKNVVEGRQRLDALSLPVGTTLKDAEMALIEATLESTQGDKETAARILGIASRTIYRKIQ
ncbi:MAG: sigma-54-dependent Fis family transcriptional regulator [bacterium]|nr:sigma-54-dependent Fis family transcriptional regulator [bacterium]